MKHGELRIDDTHQKPIDPIQRGTHATRAFDAEPVCVLYDVLLFYIALAHMNLMSVIYICANDGHGQCCSCGHDRCFSRFHSSHMTMTADVPECVEQIASIHEMYIAWFVLTIAIVFWCKQKNDRKNNREMPRHQRWWWSVWYSKSPGLWRAKSSKQRHVKP